MTNGQGQGRPDPTGFRIGLMALILCAGAVGAADRGSVRWTTPDTSLRSLTARFADPQPLLYLYRRDADDALIRLVDGPEGLATVAAAAAAVNQPVALAPWPGSADAPGIGRVRFEVADSPAGQAGALRLIDPAGGSLAVTDPLRGRPLGLLEVVDAGSSRLLAVSLESDDRLLLTEVPEDFATALIEIDLPTPPDPWAAVALPAANRSDDDSRAGDSPTVDGLPVDGQGVAGSALDRSMDPNPPINSPPDLALFGIEDDGHVVARLVHTDTGVPGPTLTFGRRLTPVDAVALPDVFPDGSPELAVLGESDDGRVAGILIKETGSGTTVGRFRLSPSYQPLALHYLAAGESGQAELLVVGLRANGALGLQRRSLAGGRASRAGPTLPLKARYMPDDTAVLRLGEDGRMILALAGADWRGQFRLEVRDAVSGALLLDRALP